MLKNQAATKSIPIILITSLGDVGNEEKGLEMGAVGLMAVDFFKQYNDIYGHSKGDEVLIRLADCLSRHLRHAYDFAARYGGEEFVFLMPDTSGEKARHMVNEICQGIEALGIPHKASPGGALTVSIGGITLVPAVGQNYSKSFELVDRMLYQSKEGGRNMVSWLYQYTT